MEMNFCYREEKFELRLDSTGDSFLFRIDTIKDRLPFLFIRYVGEALMEPHSIRGYG